MTTATAPPKLAQGRRLNRTPSPTTHSYFHAYPMGRMFVVVDCDRPGPWQRWPDEATDLLGPLASDLAELYLWRRASSKGVFLSSFSGVSGFLHAPTPVAQVVLDALWAADSDDLSLAGHVARAVAEVVAPLRAADRRFKRSLAVVAYDAVVQALADPR